MNISTIREKYPQYNDLSDKQLVDALHKKFYKDIPINQFYEKVGLIQSISIAEEPQHKEITFNAPKVMESSEPQPKTESTEAIVTKETNSSSSYLEVNPSNQNVPTKAQETGSSAYLVVVVVIGLIIYFFFNHKKNNETQYSSTGDNSYDQQSTNEDTSQENDDPFKSYKSTNDDNSYEDRLNESRNNVAKSFTILDLKSTASPSEIKAAFKTKMSSYHPDKVSGLGDKLRQLAEEETKLLNIAYKVLQKHGYTK